MVVVRDLTADDDFDEVGRVYAESWKASYRGLLPQAYLDRLTHDRWSAMLRADPAASIGLFVDDVLAGSSMVGYAREPGREGYAEIVSIYLRPRYVGQGHGRTLMQAALDKARRNGCERVCLWALSGNVRAEGFYEHMGFRPTGERQHETFGGQQAQLWEYVRELA